MEKVPFYQVFTAYETRQDQICGDDLCRMRSMYPKAARKILKEVEEECDLLEYQDSFMFHENPDRIQLEALSGKIYNRLSNINNEEKVLKAQSFLMPEPEFNPPWDQSAPDYSLPFPPGPDKSYGVKPPYENPKQSGNAIAPYENPRSGNAIPSYEGPAIIPSYNPNGEPNWLKQLIDVLLIEEMSRRRQRYFQRRIWNQ